MGPAIRLSKNSRCPSDAAAELSAYLFVVSTGSAGSGESFSIAFHSAFVKQSGAKASVASPVAGSAPVAHPAAVALPTATSATIDSTIELLNKLHLRRNWGLRLRYRNVHLWIVQ